MPETADEGATSRVAVIVVNWNGGELMARCLDGLARIRPAAWRCIVVDNGSTDGSAEAVAARHPECTLIRNDENRGFAAACNQGMERALEEGADFVFLLNNDAELRAETLGRLLAAARRHPRAGLFAGKILLPDGRIWCAGVDVGLHPNLQRLRGFMRQDHGQLDREEAVDALTGCGLLIRREVLTTVGLFDSDYFVYVEDIDLAARARKAGFESVYVPDAVMLHDAGSSTGGGYNVRRKYMVAYNLVVFVKKHGTPALWLAFIAVEILAWPLVFLAGALRGRGRAVLAKGRGTWASLLGRPLRLPGVVTKS